MSDLPEKESVVSQGPVSKGGIPESEGLTKELISAGVKVHPTTIPIPHSVQNMGVAPGAANIPMPSASTPLPITDDQIAEGLGKSLRDSFRWLAEWCLRRLKQAHVGLQSIHGKLTRVEIKTQ